MKETYLYTVDKETKKGVEYAYALFDELDDKGYYPLNYKSLFWMLLSRLSFNLYLYLFYTFAKSYKIGEWYRSSKRMMKANDYTMYRSGFHCFIDKSDAMLWRTSFSPDSHVLRVIVDDVLASGKLMASAMIVVRRMKLKEECQTNT